MLFKVLTAKHFKVFRELLVELPKHNVALAVACGDLVERFFHLCSKLEVNDVWQILCKHVTNRLPKLGRVKALFLFGYVQALLNGFYRSDIRTWTSDAFFFHFFNQACLGVAWWWYGKVLLAIHLFEIHRKAFFNFFWNVDDRLIVIIFHQVYLEEPIEDEGRAGNTKQVIASFNVHRALGILRRGHLAAHKAFPDKRV